MQKFTHLYYRIAVSILFILLINISGSSQPFLQTIKGTVIDKDSRIPLAGAMVMIMESNPGHGYCYRFGWKF